MKDNSLEKCKDILFDLVNNLNELKDLATELEKNLSDIDSEIEFDKSFIKEVLFEANILDCKIDSLRKAFKLYEENLDSGSASSEEKTTSFEKSLDYFNKLLDENSPFWKEFASILNHYDKS